MLRQQPIVFPSGRRPLERGRAREVVLVKRVEKTPPVCVSIFFVPLTAVNNDSSQTARATVELKGYWWRQMGRQVRPFMVRTHSPISPH